MIELNVDTTEMDKQIIDMELRNSLSLQKIMMPNGALDMTAIKTALESFSNNMSVIPISYSCCSTCEVMEKLPQAIQDKIQILMRLGNND